MPLDPQELDELSHHLRVVLRASHEASLATARRMGLGLNDLAALDLLGLDGPQGAAQIARRLGMRPASATVLVARLEAAGHVECHRESEDRRRVTVATTLQAFWESLDAMEPLLRALDAVARALDGHDRAVVERYLQDAAKVLEEYVRLTPR